MNNPIRENRIANFTISHWLLENHLDKVKELLKDVIVLRCEHRYDSRSFHYTGASPHFDVKPDCQNSPTLGVNGIYIRNLYKDGSMRSPKEELYRLVFNKDQFAHDHFLTQIHL